MVTATVLAGCGALAGGDGTAADGAGSGDGTPTATPDAEARLEAKLSASPETIQQRLEDLVGAEADSYPEIEVGEVDSTNSSQPFFTHLVGPPADPSSLESSPAVSYDGETITVDEAHLADGDGTVIERQVAYYYLLSLGLSNGWIGLPDRPHDFSVITRSFAYVLNVYAEQHRPAMEAVPGSYEEENVSDYEWAAGDATDYYTYRWVVDQVDTPAQVPGLLTGDGPPSSEQFLADTDDRPMALGMELGDSGEWYRGGEQRFTTHGPVVTRAVLRTGVDNATAAAAADGWGQDRYFVIESLESDDIGIVWAHRWDSSGDADEFEAATTTYLAQRRNETDDLRFEFRRLASDATVVVAGPPRFTNGTTVDYDTGNVTVNVESSS